MSELKQRLYEQLWQHPEIYGYRIMFDLGPPWKDIAQSIFNSTKRMRAEKKQRFWLEHKNEVDAAFEIWYATGKKSFED